MPRRAPSPKREWRTCQKTARKTAWSARSRSKTIWFCKPTTLVPSRHGFLANDQAIAENATKLVKQYDVRTPSIFTAIGKLSGGNQQKAIVARENFHAKAAC